jgi:glyceraldehyde 3-phosphate dehydrogenase
MPLRIAINGFGRIGRSALKIALERPGLEVVAVNDLATAAVLAHLLKYDSVYGTYEKEVQVEVADKVVAAEGEITEAAHFALAPEFQAPTYLSVAGKKIQVLSEKEPQKLPWKELGIDVVLECSGRFTKKEEAEKHLAAGAQKVIVSAPLRSEGGPTYILGVNAENYQGEPLLSNASCTTNCVTPVLAVMLENFAVAKSAMTTIHAYTAEQNLVDGPPPALHRDLRRARAAAINIVPTTTGAAKAVTAVLPSLAGVFEGLAIRVPVVCGSLADFTFLLKKPVSAEEVNRVFIKAAQLPQYQGILAVAYEPLVSADIIKNPHSAVVDLSLTKVIDGDLVKVVAWYDNEWGYSCRLVELAEKVGK